MDQSCIPGSRRPCRVPPLPPPRSRKGYGHPFLLAETPDPGGSIRPHHAYVLHVRRLPEWLIIIRASSLRILGLPVSTVHIAQRRARYRTRVYAVCIDADAIRVGSRNIEGLYSTRGTEQVPGGTGIEGVGREGFLAGNEPEAFPGNDQVSVSRAGTHGAVAYVQGQMCRRLDFEADLAAMTPSGMGHHLQWPAPAIGACTLR